MNSQTVSEFMSRKIGDRKKSVNEQGRVFAYPQNNVKELAKIMRDIRIDYMPVLSSPWNRKLIGFIELNKIRAFLKD